MENNLCFSCAFYSIEEDLDTGNYVPMCICDDSEHCEEQYPITDHCCCYIPNNMDPINEIDVLTQYDDLDSYEDDDEEDIEDDEEE